MGTDIHGAIFNRNSEGEVRFVRIADLSRNYNSFAVLGDVRNGFGFAGVKTGEGFNYITARRGLPDWLEVEDGCAYEDEEQRIWFGDHSYSYMTVKEFLDFDWTQTTTCQGVVSSEEYKSLLEKRKTNKNAIPDSYCGSVWGGAIKVVSEEEMQTAISNNDPDLLNLYCCVQWEITYKESCWMAQNELLPLLLESAQEDYENTYFVFGFDS